MFAVPILPSRLLLIVDDLARGEMVAKQLAAEGHEVRWARDTMEARWCWMKNYYDSVVICARGANGFLERIKKEAPCQNITVVSPDELILPKKPSGRVVSMQHASERKREIPPTVIKFPRRSTFERA